MRAVGISRCELAGCNTEASFEVARERALVIKPGLAGYRGDGYAL